MMMCEKVVLGYSALHHLLLYLQSKNKELITSFADCWVGLFMDKISNSGKFCCKDLGKLLIYTMISGQFEWEDIARQFLYESFTRNVKWMVAQEKYAKYNDTKIRSKRRQNTFIATTTSRRLIMFQVWFSRSNAIETLHSYNQRLGRPRHAVRHGIVSKTKEIMECNSWTKYFNELRVEIGGKKEIDQLLRFAVYNSRSKGYHSGSAAAIQEVERPDIKVRGEKKRKKKIPRVQPSVFGPKSMTKKFMPKIRATIKTKTKSSNQNAWNSKKGQSAATKLFGGSSSEKNKSTKSKSKNTEPRAQSKGVAVTKKAQTVTPQDHSTVNAERDSKAKALIMQKPEAVKSSEKIPIHQRPQRITEKRPIIRNAVPNPMVKVM